jgi:chromosome segregation ATPase
MEETIAKKEDVREIRERVAGVEPLLRQIEDNVLTIRRLEDECNKTRGIVIVNDTIINGLKAEVKMASDRISLSESSLFQLRGILNGLNEEQRVVTTMKSNIEQSLRNDVERIKSQVSEYMNSQNNQNSRIKSLEGNLSDQKEDIKSLHSSLRLIDNDRINRSFSDIRSHVSQLDGTVLSEQSKYSDLSKLVTGLRDKVDALQANVFQNEVQQQGTGSCYVHT